MTMIYHPERVCTGCMVGQGRQCRCRAQAQAGDGQLLHRGEPQGSLVGRLMRVLQPQGLPVGLVVTTQETPDLAARR